MDTYSDRMRGRVGYSSVILAFAGIFAVIQGLLAVYKPELFVAGATFWFSDLNAWGWIIFGLGVASLVAGAAVTSGTEAARWFGVLVAGLLGLGQLLFAQAYPLWALVMTGVAVAAIYSLFTHGEEEAAAARSSGVSESPGSTDVADMQARRAA
jgi:hypothetical protein